MALTGTGATAWLVRHELRLAWRDWWFMMTAGRPRRAIVVAIAAIAVIVLAHGLAYAILAPHTPLKGMPDKAVLAVITGSVFLSWTLMLSQAMETVTRVFYSRDDMALILTSPMPHRRIFAVRIGAIALSTALLAMLLFGPFVNVLAVLDGPHWLASYGVLASMGALSAALAVMMTVGLFGAFGPRRTRIVAQVAAAIVGAAFVIGVQAAAILSIGEISRLSVLTSERFLNFAPEVSSLVWLPAYAAMGGGLELLVVLLVSLGLLGVVIRRFAGRFGDHVAAASGVGMEGGKGATVVQGGRLWRQCGSVSATLRRKEWVLLLRDPWLASQTLMQILYLLPPALLLWLNYGDDVGALLIVVPIIVMAAGQLAGGLAWLAVSGEDAPELIASAPVSTRRVLIAKIEAVLGAVALVVTPLLLALALAAPALAIATSLGVVVSASSATLVQIWFRAQADRRAFGRRHVSSRIATYAEALSS
ncbi:MAG: permease, partial [Alphaproteobacteria bacterium]|nr:permease [Alphaproteobacteria bacterium]